MYEDAPKLTLQSQLTAYDITSLLWAFAEGPWKWKYLMGDLSKKSARSVCVKVENYERTFRNLYPHQAIWLLANGNPARGQTISHWCAHKKRVKHGVRLSPCISIAHMKLEPAWLNSSRNGEQHDLVKYADRWRTTLKLKGPLFVDEINVKKYENQKRRRNSNFVNCGYSNRFNGLFWQKPSSRLLDYIDRSAYSMLNIDG